MRLRLVARRWRPAGASFLYVAGDVFDVDAREGARLVKAGAAVEVESQPPPDPEPVVDVESGAPERPWKTARLDEWRSYAETLGIDTDGLSKSELIDAVDQ